MDVIYKETDHDILYQSGIKVTDKLALETSK